MPRAAPCRRARGKPTAALALLAAAACCSLPRARAQLLRRPQPGWQPPSSSPFLNGPEGIDEGADKQIFRRPNPGWQPPSSSPFLNGPEGIDEGADKQIFRQPQPGWTPPSNFPFMNGAEGIDEGADKQIFRQPQPGWTPPSNFPFMDLPEGDKQIFRQPQPGWKPPPFSPFAMEEAAAAAFSNQERPRLRRYLPMAANPATAPFSLPAEPRRGYIETDLLLAPQTHYSGGNFVAPDGAYIYYTQDGDGMLRAGRVTQMQQQTTTSGGPQQPEEPPVAVVQEKQFAHPRSGDNAADGNNAPAVEAPAGFTLKNLGSNPLITVSPDGANVYVLPRASRDDDAATTKTAGAAAVKGDIVVLGRNTESGGVRAVAPGGAAVVRDASALPCDEGLGMVMSADGKWVTAACRHGTAGGGSLFLQAFARDANAQDGALTHLHDLALPPTLDPAAPVLLIRSPDAKALYVVAWEKEGAGGKRAQAVLSYGQSATTGELRLLQTLGDLYAPNFSIDFGAFDPSGHYLFLGHGSQPTFHSWTAATTFVFSRQPGNDLALYFDPRQPF